MEVRLRNGPHTVPDTISKHSVKQRDDVGLRFKCTESQVPEEHLCG